MEWIFYHPYFELIIKNNVENYEAMENNHVTNITQLFYIFSQLQFER